jgi:hypothetical protein
MAIVRPHSGGATVRVRKKGVAGAWLSARPRSGRHLLLIGEIESFFFLFRSREETTALHEERPGLTMLPRLGTRSE